VLASFKPYILLRIERIPVRKRERERKGESERRSYAPRFIKRNVSIGRMKLESSDVHVDTSRISLSLSLSLSLYESICRKTDRTIERSRLISRSRLSGAISLVDACNDER